VDLLKDLQLLVQASGEKCIDAISNHINNELLTPKLRSVREDGFSKAEFQSVS